MNFELITNAEEQQCFIITEKWNKTLLAFLSEWGKNADVLVAPVAMPQ